MRDEGVVVGRREVPGCAVEEYLSKFAQHLRLVERSAQLLALVVVPRPVEARRALLACHVATHVAEAGEALTVGITQSLGGNPVVYESPEIVVFKRIDCAA